MNIKRFESSNNKLINIYGLSDREIISVTQEEFDELIENEFTLLYDDIGHDPEFQNQWRYDEDEEDEIKEFLKLYKSMINMYALGSEEIIKVTEDEIKILKDEDFNILYDEIGYDKNLPNQWRYDDDEENDIKKWLELYRILKDPDAVNKTMKFNL